MRRRAAEGKGMVRGKKKEIEKGGEVADQYNTSMFTKTNNLEMKRNNMHLPFLISILYM